MRSFIPLFFLISQTIWGQELIGNWSYYGDYSNMEQVTKIGDNVYCGNQYGAFFNYNLSNNSLSKLTKFNGFSDARITELTKLSDTELLIGYLNGNIDHLKNNVITNIDDIYRNQTINEDKRINQIVVIKGKSYIATDFGVVVLNNHTKLIDDTYRFIGPNATEVSVKYITANYNQDSIYIVTDNDIQYASLSSKYNLQDHASWSRFIVDTQIPVDSIVGIATMQKKVVCAANKSLYSLSDGTWSLDLDFDTPIKKIENTEGNLSLITSEKVFFEKNNTVSQIESPFITNPSEVFNQEGLSLVVDNKKGLIKIDNTNSQFFFPNGPQHSSFYDFNFSNETMSIVQGGISPSGTATNGTGVVWNQNTFEWTNSDTIAENISAIVYNDITKKTYYASFGGGLVEDAGDIKKVYDNTNTLLDTAADGKVYISDVTIDDYGNTWFTNYTNQDDDFTHALYVIAPSGSISRYAPTTRAKKNIDLKQFGNQSWLLSRINNNRNDLVVYTYDNKDLIVINYNTPESPGDITCFDISYSGQVTIGTESGIAAIFDNNEVFDENALSRPIIGDDFLFNKIKINDVKYDGGGRIWIATKEGVFLYEKDFKEQLLNFNSGNSPLLSNEVLKIGINDKNGEVLFHTKEGIFVYIGSSTSTSEQQRDNVQIFPNPIPASFEGLAAIRGVVQNANIKIVDIKGNLVYETIANGGTATWDARLLNGKRAKTGIYLIFSSNIEGEETFIGKIAVLTQ